MDIEDMVYMAVKLEKQLRRIGSAKPNGYSGFFSGWKSSFKRDGNALMKQMTTPKVVEPFFVRNQVTTSEEKEKNIAQLKHKQELNVFDVKGLGIMHMNAQIKELWYKR